MWFLKPGLTFQELIIRMIAVLVIIFLVLPFHEFAHAFVAYKLGDDTPKREGRLTINPLMHFSVIGAVCLLFFNFGWAKPVITDTRNFKNPRRDMALVALAGPLANVIAAIVGGLLLNFTPFIAPSSLAISVSMCIYYYISINVLLAVFNLMPLPSLDGFKIVESFLPTKILVKYYRNMHIITLIILILLLLGIFDLPLDILRGLLYNFIMRVTHIPFAH